MSKGNHGKWSVVDIESLDRETFVAIPSRRGGATPVNNIPDGISHSELALSKSKVDPITKSAMQQVSQDRMEYLNAVASRTNEFGPRPNLANAQPGIRKSLIKEASIGTEGQQFHIAGRGNSTHLAPNLYSPLFLTANLQLPRDRITANAWNRAFYETNPIVRNACNMHATYPINKLNIKCHDKKKEQFFMDMVDRVDLVRVLQDVACEYYKLGECFPYASFDSSSGMWDKIYLHNPDYISVKATPIPGTTVISLKPDPELHKIVTSSDPVYAKLRERLDPRIIDHVIRNEYIPLDDFNISHLKMLSSPYDLRGTSIITSVWKDLVLWDLYRESKFSQADAMVNPLTLVKVGNSNPDGHYPRPEELSAMRDIFEMAEFDKNFKIFTHPDVAVERVGFSGGVLDITSDLNFILDNLFMGLMVPKSVITQEGATYASASIGLEVMRQRYENFRTMIANWLTKKIFAPIAEINDFYEYSGGTKRLIVPDIEWNKMALFDLDNYIGHLLNLMDKQPTNAPAGVSRTSLYRSLGLDFKDELSNQKKEVIQMTILAKEMQEIQNMSLSELRSLDATKPIIENEVAPLPGVPESADAGGEVPMPDMGGGLPPEGGLPPLPEMP